MARKLRDIKRPVKDLKLDIKAMPEWLALVVYEENVMQYDETRRGDILEYLVICKNLIESYGVRCEIEGVRYARKQKSIH